MVVGVSVCELHLPGVQSLKGKRKIVKSLVERLHKRYRISVAETDFHDLHQRAEVCVAAVGRREGEVEHLLEDLRSVVELEPEAMISHWATEILTLYPREDFFTP